MSGARHRPARSRDLGAVREFDRRGVHLLHGWATHPGLDGLVSLVAQAGDAVVALVLLAAWLWPRPRRWRRRATVLTSVLAYALSYPLSFGLSHVAGRSRPGWKIGVVPLLPSPSSASFPSHHTMVGAALAWPLVFRWPRAGSLTLIWTLVVGLARVAGGVHYPTDVLGGIAAAAVPGLMGKWLASSLVCRVPRLRRLVR